MSFLETANSVFFGQSHEVNTSDWRNIRYAKAVLWRQDPELMKNLRDWIEDKLAQLPENNKDIARASLLSYLPYTSPKAGDTITIDGTSYCYGWVSLTPTWLPSQHQYRVLTLSAKGKTSWVVFMGTTYPSCPGFWATILADVFPFDDIGSLLSYWGRSRFNRWLDKQESCFAVGTSLGGALVEKMTNHAKVKAQYLFNPALPYKSGQALGNQTIVLNEGDIVSQLGQVPNGAKVIQFQAESQCRCVKCGFYAHFQAWSLRPNVVAKEIAVENHPQLFARWFVYWVLRMVAFLLILPFYLVSVFCNGITDIVVAFGEYMCSQPKSTILPTHIPSSGKVGAPVTNGLQNKSENPCCLCNWLLS